MTTTRFGPTWSDVGNLVGVAALFIGGPLFIDLRPVIVTRALLTIGCLATAWFVWSLVSHTWLTVGATGFRVTRLLRRRSYSWLDVRNVGVDDWHAVNILKVHVRAHDGTLEWIEAMPDPGLPVYRIRDLMLERARAGGAMLDLDSHGEIDARRMSEGARETE